MVGPYNGRDYHTKFKCTICGYEWETSPGSVYNCGNNICPKCQRIKQIERTKKSNEQFLLELKSITNTIIPLEQYKLSGTPILCKCTKCEHIWKITPNHLLQGHGCPNCSKSVGEKLVEMWFKNRKIEYKSQVQIKVDTVARNTNKVIIDFIVCKNDKTYYIEYNGR